MVLAYNEVTGEIDYYPVIATISHEDPVVQYLTIDDETIITTPNHPFYTTAGEWVTAGELQIGDTILRANGGFGTVTATTYDYQPQYMYNLTVDIAHTYFVGNGEWLVHNCKDYANTANLALRQLPENMRGATIAMTMENGSKPVLAVFGRTQKMTEDAIQFLRNKGWNVLDAPSGRTPDFHAERQLYDAGYTEIGISRQAGMCPSCQAFFDDKPHVTVTEYKP